ncbi:hypothetical protein KHA80_00495 [Anaerobacillus sp. HL2]|nr:hypothetical protein KHA80_00495 [Anaerobacillus sp. HL2]
MKIKCGGEQVIKEKWLFVNVITIILIVNWGFYQGFTSYYILSAKIFSQVAI